MFLFIPQTYFFCIIGAEYTHWLLLVGPGFYYKVPSVLCRVKLSGGYQLLYSIAGGPLGYYIYIFKLYTAAAEQPAMFKLTFKRKGGWIHLRRNWPYVISFRFGYSHPVRYYYNSLHFRRYKKHLAYHGLLFTGLGEWDLASVGYYLRSVRYLGMYTRRGIRFARQQLILRKGKESQYTKLKSKIF